MQSIKPRHADCLFVRQAEALGLGHAVLCAEKIVDGEPFAVILADDLLDGQPPVLLQMLDVFGHYACSVVGVDQIEPQESRSYGVIDGRAWDDRIFRISGIVEKPEAEAAPSRLGGRYVFTPGIFEHLRRLTPGAGNEIQLTDAILSLIAREQVLAYRFRGKRYDCGSKLGYLKATVEFALRHAEVGDGFERYLEERAFENEAAAQRAKVA